MFNNVGHFVVSGLDGLVVMLRLFLLTTSVHTPKRRKRLEFPHSWLTICSVDLEFGWLLSSCR